MKYDPQYIDMMKGRRKKKQKYLLTNRQIVDDQTKRQTGNKIQIFTISYSHKLTIKIAFTFCHISIY